MNLHAQALPDAARQSALNNRPGTESDASASQNHNGAGSISGTIVDQGGRAVPAATIRCVAKGSTSGPSAPPESVTTVVADSSGHFILSGLPAGNFRITIAAEGFATQELAAVVRPGESLQLPDIALAVGAATTEVHVSMTEEELAETQVKVEETQRVLGAIPNFYVTYNPNALPLTSRQKFELAWKTAIDPVTIIATGVSAGIQQATDTFNGYGQGAQGYAKRYGAGYADAFIGIMLGGAVLPSLLKQDPRYFYKGTGTVRRRAEYAIANAVVCKGDNGKWQFNYSGILSGLASGGISNLYYPAANRDGAGLTFENAGIGIGFSAVGNLFQEFLVRKLTPHTHTPSQP